MKKSICAMLIAVTCFSMLLVGCVNNGGAKPDSYKGITWTSSDYSFRFTPDDDCKGIYKYNEKKYNIQAVFSANTLVVVDVDKNDTQLFDADWKYEDEEKLYIYNISFNTDAYKEMKNNLLEFITLHQEKIKK